MPTITMFNPKGGCGKSTAALILATELAEAGASVAILDGDPNPNLYLWAERRDLPRLPIRPPSVRITDIDAPAVRNSTEALELVDQAFGDAKFVAVRCRDDKSVAKWIHALSQRFAFVICDPEGTANAWVTPATQMASLVIMPLRPSPMDADQMMAGVEFLESLAMPLGREIPFQLLITCCGPFITKDEDRIRQGAAEFNYPVIPTRLAERAAFRAMIGQRMTLAELGSLPTRGPDAIAGIDKARSNAGAFCADVLEALNLKDLAA